MDDLWHLRQELAFLVVCLGLGLLAFLPLPEWLVDFVFGRRNDDGR